MAIVAQQLSRRSASSAVRIVRRTALVITFRHAHWDFSADPDATRIAYGGVAQSGPQACSCLDCRNYVAVGTDFFPRQFRELCSLLGIDLYKPAEVCGAWPQEDGTYLYNGWFVFVGNVICADDKIVTLGDFQYWPGSEGHLAPDSFSGQQCARVEFSTRLPWMLPEPSTLLLRDGMIESK